MAKKHLEEKKIFGSLNIIVKDEEKNLREILKNVQNVFDEVIIVDIGSKDLSPNIAGELGVKVITHRWMEDFSKVRNMALEKSTGEWIFYIDANERINRDDAVMIKSLIDKPTKFDAFLFPVITMVESKELESLEMIRLFRNNNEYSFQGRVFEQIGPSIIKNGGKIKRIKDIKILNNISSIDSIQENVKRNLNLLKKQLEDEPKDPYMLTQTAWTAYKASDLLFAKKTAAKVLKIQNAPDTFRFRCFLLLGKIALDEKDHVKCEEFFDLALSLDPKSRELFFLLGLLNREKGENDQAIDFFENALKTPVKLSYHVPDIRVSKVDIHYNIAYSNLYLGEYSKAVESLEFLLEEEEHISSYLLLSEIFLKQADYQKALEYLEKA
ncbi:glycosyltransferase, partial [bacterium]|nr:glycosyltransferase [bacterium]